MILNKDIKKRVSQYLREKLGMYDYRRGWLKSDCPYCGDHKFGVNLSSNRTNCFKCGNHPSIIQLIMDLEYLSTLPEVMLFLKTFDGVEFYEELVEAHQLKENVTLPEGFKNLSRGKGTIAKAARNYIRKRGFDPTELARKGWGYGTLDKYFGYIIMPFYVKGRIVYFNARRFMGDGPKFNNPLVEDFGLGKNMLIYNMDALLMYKTIYAVESVMNAETIGGNSIALGGKKVSNYQINAIIKSPCEKIIIGLDDDAIEDAIKLALDLVPHKKVKIMQFPEKKDINDLGRGRSLKISHTTRYLNYNQVLGLKYSIG